MEVKYQCHTAKLLPKYEFYDASLQNKTGVPNTHAARTRESKKITHVKIKVVVAELHPIKLEVDSIVEPLTFCAFPNKKMKQRLFQFYLWQGAAQILLYSPNGISDIYVQPLPYQI